MKCVWQIFTKHLVEKVKALETDAAMLHTVKCCLMMTNASCSVTGLTNYGFYLTEETLNGRAKLLYNAGTENEGVVIQEEFTLNKH